MRFMCPVCGAELTIRHTPSGRPVGGLYEVVVVHHGHCAKVVIDERGFIRRVHEVECIHIDEMAVYINGNRAVVVRGRDRGEILADYIKTAVETELQIRTWRTGP